MALSDDLAVSALTVFCLFSRGRFSAADHLLRIAFRGSSSRRHSCQHRSVAEPDSLIADILQKLAQPAGSLRDDHAELELYFVGAMEPLLRLLGQAEQQGSGMAHFAVRHLIARAMSDLIASVHLILHGYLNQGYGTLRTAYEALDIVDLLATGEEEAAKWMFTEKGYAEFSPSAVRKRLGRPKFDEIYSKLSEFTHPRIEAAQLGAVEAHPPGAENQEITIHVGPFLIDETPDLWLATTFLVPLTFGVLTRQAHLVTSGAIQADAWDRAAMAMQNSLIGMTELIARRLGDFGKDASDFAETWKAIPEMINGMRRGCR
jgi:hypothetical protein